MILRQEKYQIDDEEEAAGGSSPTASLGHDLFADGLEALLAEVLSELAVGHRKNQILALPAIRP